MDRPAPPARSHKQPEASPALELSYCRGPLLADYGRSGLGFLLCAPPLVLADMLPWVRVALAAMTVLFLYFGWQTWRRQRTIVRVCSTAIELVGGQQARLAWSELGRLRLRFFGSRREGRGGWMELQLEGDGGQQIAVLSSLERFDAVVDQAEQAASAKRLPLDAATEANLACLLGRSPSA
jgi:hypothetical protein